MKRLPSLTPRALVAVLKKAGFEEVRQRGSHLFLRHPGREVIISVPMHARELPRGTLAAIVRHPCLTEEELRTLF